jgi:hypothetical protein
MVPAVVEAYFEKVATGLIGLYDNRRQAITTAECFNIVDELRQTWEVELPRLIVKELNNDSQVYQSSADCKEKRRGQKCEAVHYLIFITFKLFNKASQVLSTIKKNEILSGQSTLALKKHHELVGAMLPHHEEDSVEKAGWRSNPAYDIYLEEAHQSVERTDFPDQRALEAALRVSIAKLISANKPKLQDCLKHLASIVALKGAALVRGWVIDRRFFYQIHCSNLIITFCVARLYLHRNVFQFKMLEHWNQISFTKTYDDFRYLIFCSLNSMLMLLSFCGEIATVRQILSENLQPALKPAFRKDFDIAMHALSTTGTIHPMFRHLQILASTTDYGSFYAKVYVVILQFIAAKKGQAHLSETLLLNLMHDLPVTNDVSKLSSAENKDYCKVISIVSTTILVPQYNAATDTPMERKQYCEAALFLGSKLRSLVKVDHLTRQEEADFWIESPFMELSNLRARIKETNIYNTLPLIRLPKLYEAAPPCQTTSTTQLTVALELAGIPIEVTGNPTVPLRAVVDGQSDSLEVHSKPASPNPIMPVQSRNNEVRPTLTRSMKVHELREILARRGLPCTGKKGELQLRVVGMAGYTLEKSLLKRHRSLSPLGLNNLNNKDAKRAREASDSDDADSD